MNSFKRIVTLVATLVLLPFAATAEIIGVVELEQGRTLRFHNVTGPCKGQALLVEYIEPGSEAVPGCWRAGHGQVSMVFLDGDVAAIPVAMVRTPRVS